MPRNVEIKARVPQPNRLLDAVLEIADRGPTVFAQDDTFFACPAGRLKLRTFAPTEGQLIFYRRPDVAGPKLSEYVLSATSEPDALRGILALAYGVVGRVRKTRTLCLVGQTRIHLDDVGTSGTSSSSRSCSGPTRPSRRARRSRPNCARGSASCRSIWSRGRMSICWRRVRNDGAGACDSRKYGTPACAGVTRFRSGRRVRHATVPHRAGVDRTSLGSRFRGNDE